MVSQMLKVRLDLDNGSSVEVELNAVEEAVLRTSPYIAVLAALRRSGATAPRALDDRKTLGQLASAPWVMEPTDAPPINRAARRAARTQGKA
jgi:hypothetical protein